MKTRHHLAHGFTLTEMMTALAVGLLVVLSASALLHRARAVYVELDDSARVQETGRLSLSHLRTMLSQANHLPWESMLQSRRQLLRTGGLHGLDNRSGGAAVEPATDSFSAGAAPGVNQSDVLMIGFFGTPGAGNVSSCASGAIRSTQGDGRIGSQGNRTWVIYFIGQTGKAEPELRCRYRSASGIWRSEAVAPGIESMQLLYGVDSDTVAGADRWYSAAQMSPALWSRVRLVRIALLVRGKYVNARGAAISSFELLGPGAHSVRINTSAPPSRLRAVFDTTVMLRNKVPSAQAPS